VTRGTVTVEWEASPAGDVIADAVVALVMHAQSSAASIRLTSKPCRHPRDTDDGAADEQAQKRQRDSDSSSESRLRFLFFTLKDQFANVEVAYEGNSAVYEIHNDSGLESGLLDEDGILSCTVNVSFDDESGSNAKISVECKDEKLATNVRECLKNVATAMVPIEL
jgi:hypothetical protein